MDERDELEMELDEPNDNEWNEESFAQRMDRVSNASQNLGALLLQGWTMLAEECTQCHTPMMSLRGDTPRCVMCNPVSDTKVIKPKPVNPVIPGGSTVVISRPSRSKELKRSVLSRVDERHEFRPSVHKSNTPDHITPDPVIPVIPVRNEVVRPDPSARIGELLLKGWTMLAEHCPKCQSPLMSLRGGPSMCCICDTPKEVVIQSKQVKKLKKVTVVNEEKSASKPVKIDHPTGMNGFVERTGVADDVPSGNTGNLEEARNGMDHRNDGNDYDHYGYDGYHEAEYPEYRGQDSFEPYHHGPPHHRRGRKGRRARCRGRGRGHHGHHGHHGPPRGHFGYGPPPPFHHEPTQPRRHPGPLFFGFGRRADEQLGRNIDDIASTAIAKMNECHERIKASNGSVLQDMQELKAIVEFLHTVQKLKEHGMH